MTQRPLTLRATRVVTPKGVIEQGAVRIKDGQITAVDHATRLPDPAHGDTLTGALLLPGFIDLHVHGCGGYAFDAGSKATRAAARLLAHHGVTTCWAGLGAGPSIDAIAETVAAAAGVTGADTGGARVAGVFMEGPFISRAKRGAWNPDHLRLPNADELRALVRASGDRIRKVNVAPELPGALAFIRAARELGIVVAIGHSNTTYEQAMAAVAAGATITNHTFNAMSPLDHRAPGLVGATMAADTLLAELILDGIHVHPAAARALLNAKGSAGVAIITDGSPMLGLPDGVYTFLGRTVAVADGACRLSDGTLAGSVSPFDRNVRIAVRDLGVGPDDLARITSGNAARAMGLTSRGAIAPGKDADLVLLDDAYEVRATVVAGRVVYRRDEV